jgi:hypothetical protein
MSTQKRCWFYGMSAVFILGWGADRVLNLLFYAMRRAEPEPAHLQFLATVTACAPCQQPRQHTLAIDVCLMWCADGVVREENRDLLGAEIAHRGHYGVLTQRR